MNSFPNYNIQYCYGQPWLPSSYYSQGYGQNYYTYYANPYTYPQMTIYPTSDNLNTSQKINIQSIKVQENIQPPKDNEQEKQSSKVKKVVKVTKRRGFLPKLSQVDKDIYVHPPKTVQHKVKYFDPNAAPVVTSAPYNLVEELEKEIKRCQQIQNLNQENPNQLLIPQQDNLPFIVFKNRRIKKKFKKYIRSSDQYYNGLRAVNQQSYNKSDSSSQLSQSDDSDEDYSENSVKGYKRRKNIVKHTHRQKNKRQKESQVINISSNQNRKSKR